MRGKRNTLESFWLRVDKLGPIPELKPNLGCCWLWLGRPTPRGYGQHRWEGKMMRAHRVAWLVSVGPIPAGLFVLHHCDNPPCVNPAHLWLGTHDDNMRDRQEKGRTHVGPYADTSNWKRGDAHYSRTNPELLARGDRHPRRLHPEKFPVGDAHYARTQPHRLARGDRHGNTRIPDKDALSMALLQHQGVSVSAIAKQFREKYFIVWQLLKTRGPRLLNEYLQETESCNNTSTP